MPRPALLLFPAALALAGCAATPDTGSGADPAMEAHVKWLGAHPLTSLPEREARPRSADTCPETHLKPEVQPLALPESLRAALVQTRARPWSFVRYDIDESGVPGNLKVIESSGFPDFDEAARVNIATWRFGFRKGVRQAVGCVSLVSTR